MKISIKNLGALKQAEFSLGDLTIICGGNNTGKTYATYALFGFLLWWPEDFHLPVPDHLINQLLNDGTVHIDVSEYIHKAPEFLAARCKSYAKELPVIFATSADRFTESAFTVSLDAITDPLSKHYEQHVSTANTGLFLLTKQKSSSDLLVTLLVEKEKLRIPHEVISDSISDALKNIVFGQLFPRPFIASAERTGAAIFRKELNFARNRLLDDMAQKKDIKPLDLFNKNYQSYALPVESNVDFTRRLEEFAKKTSFIAEKHPEILNDFADIIGGEYAVTKDDALYYIPNKGKRVKLTMDESSSAVRSLLDIGFYLKHLAQQGDLLMVDEPELNLHPDNQRRVARLFARLINLGIKVFITTHSDYIIKELNILIMLNHDKPHLKRIAEEEKYHKDELIKSERIRVYIAEEATVKQEGKQRGSKCQTLTAATIDPEHGIEARSFDSTIDAMNQIQDAIVWGGE